MENNNEFRFFIEKLSKLKYQELQYKKFFRGEISYEKFQKWIKLESLRRNKFIPNEEEIWESVEKSVDEKNLKIEKLENNKWIKYE